MRVQIVGRRLVGTRRLGRVVRRRRGRHRQIRDLCVVKGLLLRVRRPSRQEDRQDRGGHHAESGADRAAMSARVRAAVSECKSGSHDVALRSVPCSGRIAGPDRAWPSIGPADPPPGDARLTRT